MFYGKHENLFYIYLIDVLYICVLYVCGIYIYIYNINGLCFLFIKNKTF